MKRWKAILCSGVIRPKCKCCNASCHQQRECSAAQVCWNRFVSVCGFICPFVWTEKHWLPVTLTMLIYRLLHALLMHKHTEASVVSDDEINVILKYIFKQHLNVHKPHDFFCSLLHLVSCSKVNISTCFFCGLTVMFWILVKDCCLFVFLYEDVVLEKLKMKGKLVSCFVFSFVHVSFVSLSYVVRLYKVL